MNKEYDYGALDFVSADKFQSFNVGLLDGKMSMLENVEYATRGLRNVLADPVAAVKTQALAPLAATISAPIVKNFSVDYPIGRIGKDLLTESIRIANRLDFEEQGLTPEKPSTAAELGRSVIGTAAFIGAGALTGGTAAYWAMGMDAAANFRTDQLQQYVQKTGDTGFNDFMQSNLKETDNTTNLLISAGYGWAMQQIERMGGVENLFFKDTTGSILKTLVQRQGVKGLAKTVASSAIGEGAEEYAQTWAEYVANALAGTLGDKTYKDYAQEALTGAAYGAIIGGGFGTMAHYKYKNALQETLDQAFTPIIPDSQERQVAVKQATEDLVNDASERLANEVLLRSGLRSRLGAGYDRIETAFRQAVETAGQDRRDFITPEERDEYIMTTANQFATEIVTQADQRGVPVSDMLDIIQPVYANGRIYAYGTDYLNPNFTEARIAELNTRVDDLKTQLDSATSNLQKMEIRNQINEINANIRQIKKVLGIRQSVEKSRTTPLSETTRTKLAQTSKSAAQLEKLRSLSGTTTGTAQVQSAKRGVFFGNVRVPVQYRVVELNDLKTSHNVQGEVNPDYNQILQNRNRAGIGSIAQIDKIARTLEADRLLESPEAAQGSPSVLKDGSVLTGNGRVLAIRTAMEKYPERAESYFNRIRELYPEAANMQNPVLVRELEQDYTPEQYAALVDISQKGGAAFSKTEIAYNDAQKLTADTLDFQSFMSKLIVSDGDLVGQYVNSQTGEYNADAIERYENAMMAYIFPDRNIIEDVIIGNEERIGKIKKAIVRNAESIIGFDIEHKDSEYNLLPAIRTGVADYKATIGNSDLTEFFSTLSSSLGFDNRTFASDSMCYMFRRGDTADIDSVLSYYFVEANNQMSGSMIPLTQSDIIAAAIQSNIPAETETRIAEKKALLTSLGMQPATTLFQEQDDNELVVYHKISESNLTKALDLGGLPVPSLAITKASQEFGDFGDITLVGNKEMIDPANPLNEVYNRDVWTKTFPMAAYNKVKSATLDSFRKKFADIFNKAGDSNGLSSLIYTAQAKNPVNAVREFENSNGAKLDYVQNVLKRDVEIPMESVANFSMPFLTPNEQFIESIAQIDSNESFDKWSEKIESAVRNLIDNTNFGEKFPEKFKQAAINNYFKDNGHIEFGVADRLVYDAKRYMSHKGEVRVDSRKLRDNLDQIINENYDAYYDWAVKTIQDSLVGEPMIQIGKKLVPWNMDNIVAYMIDGATKTGQESLIYGTGKVIAAGAKRLKSIADIKVEGKNIVTDAAAKQIIAPLNDSIMAFSDQFMTSSDFTMSMEQKEAAVVALGKTAALQNPTKESLRRNLIKEIPQTKEITDSILNEGMEIISNVKNLARDYFEAKPQRAVSISEFTGAIIPTDSRFDDIANRLSEMNLRVVRNDNQVEGVEEFADVLFQTSRTAEFDSVRGAIKLTAQSKPADLPHELAHFWLDNIWNYYKSGRGSEQWRTDQEVLFRYLDVDTSKEFLSRESHEKFAKSYEAFAAGRLINRPEGINPNYTGFNRFVRRCYLSARKIFYKDKDGHIERPVWTPEAFKYFAQFTGQEKSALLDLETEPRAEGKAVQSTRQMLIDEGIRENADMLERDAQAETVAQETIPTEKIELPETPKQLSAPIVESGLYSRDETLETKKGVNGWYFKSTVEKQTKQARKLIEKDIDTAIRYVYQGGNATVDRGVLARELANVLQQQGRKDEAIAIREFDSQVIARQAAKTLGLRPERTMLEKSYDMVRRQLITNAAVKQYGNLGNALEKLEKDLDSNIRNLYAGLRNANALTDVEKIKRGLEQISNSVLGIDKPIDNIDTVFGQADDIDLFVDKAIHVLERLERLGMKEGDYDKIADLVSKVENATTGDYFIDNHYMSVPRAKALTEWARAVYGYAPSNFWDKAATLYYKAAPLFNVPTHVKNVVSNTVMQVQSRASRRVLYGIKEHVIDPELIRKFKKLDSEITKATGIVPGKIYNLTSPIQILGEKKAQVADPTMLDIAAEKSLNLLSLEDSVFGSASFYDEIAFKATRTAMDEKLTGEAMKKRATELFYEYLALNNQTPDGIVGRNAGVLAAQTDTFVNQNRLTRAVANVRNGLNQIGINNSWHIGDIASPFITVGANIVRGGYMMSGGNIINAYLSGKRPTLNFNYLNELLDSGIITREQSKEIYKNRKINNVYIDTLKQNGVLSDEDIAILVNAPTKAQVAEMVSQQTKSTLGAWSVMALLLEAALYFGDDKDEPAYIPPYEMLKPSDRKKYGAISNNNFNSIKIGGKYINLDYFGILKYPMTSYLSVRSQGWQQFLPSIVNAVTDLPVISDLSDLFGKYKYADSTTDYLATTAGLTINKLSTVIPNIANNIGKAIDPYYRNTGSKAITGNKSIDRELNNISVKMFGLGGLYLDPKKINGKPMTRNRWLTLFFGNDVTVAQ